MMTTTLLSRSCAPAALGAAAVAALMAGCGTRQVNRAALVPHMTPTLRSGAPMDTPMELSLGASSVTHLGDIESGDDTAAVEVPGTQIEGAFRARLGQHVSLGLMYAQGFDSTAEPGKAQQPAVDHGDARGWGVALGGMVPTSDPRWHVGINVELLLWSLPYIEYSTGSSGYTLVEEGRGTVSQAAIGIVPTYTTGRLNLFGGLTIRNHPTIKQKGVESGIELTDDIQEGPANFVVSAGVEGELGRGVRGSLVVYAPIPSARIRSPPSLAAMLTIPLGPRTSAAAPPRACARPPAGAAPGTPVPVGPGGTF